MKNRSKRILTVLLAVGAAGVFLGASQGSQTDPLVTMSYINQVTTPKILSEVDVKLSLREQALVDRLNAAITQYEKDMDQKLSGSTGTAVGGSSAFTVVSVASGQQLIASSGGEFLLRSGTATAVAASAPGLIDTTGGGTLAAGGAIAANHLYLTTADGRGLKASSAVTVMVRGSYTVS